MTTFDAPAIADFGRYLGAEGAVSVDRVMRFATEQGMSDAGFGDASSLLAPLGELVSGPASGLVTDGFTQMKLKLCQLGDTVIAAAKQYGEVEGSNVGLASEMGVSSNTCTPAANPYLEGGGSQFTVADLELTAPDRPTASFTDQISGSVEGAVLEFLDWVWTEFEVDGGKSFTGSMLEPLVGNPGSIAANGEAWKSAAAGMGDVAGTMGANLGELAANYWQGDAADALTSFATTYWKDGAAWVATQVGDFLATGFDKVSSVSTELAGTAIEAIETIIKMAVKLAARAIPIVGWAWTAVEAVGSFLGWLIGIEIDNLIDDINKIIDMAKRVLNVFEAMKQIVESMKSYVNQVQEIANFVASIPDLTAVDAAEIADKVKGLPEKQKAVTDALDQGGKAIGEVDAAAAKVAGE
ncbi:MAG: hypothetical protein L0G99_10750 [Propionibacteriales bacterium]|nr:hypothetical protein [Propionibacteriales bacterium]